MAKIEIAVHRQLGTVHSVHVSLHLKESLKQKIIKINVSNKTSVNGFVEIRQTVRC